MIKRIENFTWIYYILDDSIKSYNKENVGKWIYFFEDSDIDLADNICKKAIQERIVCMAKYTNLKNDLEFVSNNNYSKSGGVCCFYVNLDNVEAHRMVIKFFIDNNLIKRTKIGSFYNIAFIAADNESQKDFDSIVGFKVNQHTGKWILES